MGTGTPQHHFLLLLLPVLLLQRLHCLQRLMQQQT
jgi:hypothetical protein